MSSKDNKQNPLIAEATHAQPLPFSVDGSTCNETGTKLNRTLKAYVPPRLVKYGDIATLTHSGASTGPRDVLSRRV